MGCGASRGVEVRPLSPVVPCAGSPDAKPEAKQNSEPAILLDAPSSFTDMQGLPSPAPTITPTEGTSVGGILAEVVAPTPQQPPQLETPAPRVRPKRPPGAPPPAGHVASATSDPAKATGLVLELPEPHQAGPPGATPGRQRKIPRPPPLQVGLTLELMSEGSEEEESPVPPRKSLVQVGISGATPRSIREIDQSGDYRGIITPKGVGSPFLGSDMFDESDSDAMSSCSEDSAGTLATFRTLREHGNAISGSQRPNAPEWRWQLDTDLDQLRQAISLSTPLHSLASSSPLVEISLPGCSLGPGALSVIASVLLEGGAANLRQTLHTLCLADNHLLGADPAAHNPSPDADLSGLCALADALRGSAPIVKAPDTHSGTGEQGRERQPLALTALDLRRNMIGPKGVMILAGAVWATDAISPVQLQRLQLSDNYITGSVLSAPLSTATATESAVAVQGDVDDETVPTKADPKVGSAKSGWIWQLDASPDSFNYLLARNNQESADTSGDTPTETVPRPFFLNLRGVLHPQARQLVSLELRKCYLGSVAANMLLKSLMSSSSGAQLDLLDLYHNRIGDKAAAALCRFAATGACYADASRTHGAGGIRKLLLGFNGLTHLCCKPIGDALQSTSRKSGSSNEHVSRTDDNRDQLKPLWGLQYLDLTWNALESRGIKSICKSIGTAAAEGKVSLKRVRLSDMMEDTLDLQNLQLLLDGGCVGGVGDSDKLGRATANANAGSSAVIRNEGIGGDSLGISFVATKTKRKACAHSTSTDSASVSDESGNNDDDEHDDNEDKNGALANVAGFEIVLKQRK